MTEQSEKREKPRGPGVGSTAGLGAIAIIAGFFLPWVGFGFLGSMSGLDIVRAGLESEPTLLAVAASPLMAALALAVLSNGKPAGAVGVLAGLIPWLLTGYVVYKLGGPASRVGVSLESVIELVMKGTDYGLWMALVGGVVLMVSSGKR